MCRSFLYRLDSMSPARRRKTSTKSNINQSDINEESATLAPAAGKVAFQLPGAVLLRLAELLHRTDLKASRAVDRASRVAVNAVFSRTRRVRPDALPRMPCHAALLSNVLNVPTSHCHTSLFVATYANAFTF